MQGDVDQSSSYADEAVRSFRRSNATLPALSLPHELLSMIFEYSYYDPGPPKRMEEFQSTSRTIRLAICSTCHFWRKIAILTTSLWCNLRVHIDNPGRLSQTIPLFELETERAGERVRRLRITTLVMPPSQFQEPWSALATLVKRHSKNFDSIFIQGVSMSTQIESGLFLADVDPSTSPIDFARLHTFVIVFPTTYGRLLDDMGTLDLAGAPLLHNLAICYCRVPIRLAAGHHLTKLRIIHNSDISSDIRLLQSCPNLRELSWGSVFHNVAAFHEEENARLHFPVLQNLLYIVEAPDTMSTSILRMISAPQLRCLVLGSSVPSPNQFPHLDYLTLLCDQTGDAITALRSTPTIHKLQTELSYYKTRRFFEALAKLGPDGQFELVPHLRRLTMEQKQVKAGEAEILQVRNSVKQDGEEMSFNLRLLPPGVESGQFEPIGDERPGSVEYEEDAYTNPYTWESWPVLEQ